MRLSVLVRVLDIIAFCETVLGANTRNQMAQITSTMSRATFYRYVKFAESEGLLDISPSGIVTLSGSGWSVVENKLIDASVKNG